MQTRDFKTNILPVSKKLLRFAVHLLNDEEKARDAVQDVFLKLWQKRETLGQVENIEAFAMRMTRNRCLDLIRADRIIPIDRMTALKMKDETEDVQMNWELGESAEQIKKLIDRLPDLQRNVMEMRDIQQLTFEEIADITGMNVNAIRVNLSRARKKVRDEFLRINENGHERNKSFAATIL